MDWQKKAEEVAAALGGTIIEWHPVSEETFASVVVQTDDGVFHGRYDEKYLSMGNDIFDTYEGACGANAGIDPEGNDRFEVVWNAAKPEDVERVIRAFDILDHPDKGRVIDALRQFLAPNFKVSSPLPWATLRN